MTSFDENQNKIYCVLRRDSTIFNRSKVNYLQDFRKESKLKSEPQNDRELANAQQEKINTLAQTAKKDLLTIHTVFPFKFFTDDLIIDPVKISHIHRVFFFSEQIKSIFIENIRSTSISSGPLFSTLSILDNVLTPNIIKIRPLIKGQALKAQNLIQGMIASKKEKIDNTTIANQKPQTLENIGKIENPTL